MCVLGYSYNYLYMCIFVFMRVCINIHVHECMHAHGDAGVESIKVHICQHT